MDAGGHEEIGKDAGEEILKNALEKGACAEKGDEVSFRITAFPLGNWLTDISQVVDTQLYRKLNTFLENLVKTLANKATSTVAGYQKTVVDRTREFIKEHFSFTFYNQIDHILDAISMNDVKDSIESYQKETIAKINRLFIGKDPSNPDSDTSDLANAMEHLVSYVAFFRFVFTVKGSDEKAWGMDYKSFRYVLQQHFSQYFPYEHQDRPAVGKNNFDSRPSQWKKNDFDNTIADKDGKDCYEYLRENILVNAGKLASIDKRFASYAFNPKKNGFEDTKGNRVEKLSDSHKEFNLHLADLGRTVHSIEDFFAHTIFIDYISEHNKNCDKYKKKFPHYDTILQKRKKKWTSNYKSGVFSDNWEKMSRETDIVSGYFDPFDTVISLLQKADSLLNIPAIDNTAGDKVQWIADKARGAYEYEYKKLFTDSILLIQEPGTEWDKGSSSPDPDDKNAAAELLKKNPNVDKILSGLEGDESERINAVVDNVLKSEKFTFIPGEIKENFRNGVDLFVRGYAAYNLYKSLVTLFTIIKNPLAWFKKLIPDQIREILESMLINEFYRLLGTERVGCHSLIAKDNSTDLFYDSAMHLAKTVHYQVMHVMTRHLKTSTVQIGKQGEHTARMSSYVDWLHMLEYFLDNPYNAANIALGEEEFEGPVEMEYITNGNDTLETIADAFQPTTFGSMSLTWREIAKANHLYDDYLSDEENISRINEEMEISGLGYTIDFTSSTAFYKFNSGVTLLIPNQAYKFKRYKYESMGRKRWWDNVINHKDGWLIIYRYGEKGELIDSENGKKVVPHSYRMLPMTKNNIDKLIERAKAKQKELENAYKKG